MKKRINYNFSLFGFVMFFTILLLTTIINILIFTYLKMDTRKDTVGIIFAVCGNVLLGTIICTICDIYRRKIIIDEPTKKILEATKKITAGNFDIHLEISHKRRNFNEYDLIMENINTMSSELLKNEVLKEDFISNVSHEIKTPLSIIQNYAQLLSSENIDEDTRKKYLSELVITTKRLSNLIGNILKLNKLENQKLQFDIEKFNLGESLRECVLQYEELYEKKKLNLICEIDDVEINSSQANLEIVWNNLISNAIKFTEDEGNIQVSLKDKKDYVIVEVSDSGCGISQDIGEKIFDKFFQGDTSHSVEGNGLGLSLVKKVIDVLGGEISVESQLGEGSTFSVKLKKDIYE